MFVWHCLVWLVSVFFFWKLWRLHFSINVTQNSICSNFVSVAGIGVAQPAVLKLHLKSPPVWLSWWLVRVSKHQSASPEGKNRSMWMGFSYSRQWYLPIWSSVALAAGLTGSDSSQNLRRVWFIYFQGGPPFFKCRPRAQKNVRNSLFSIWSVTFPTFSSGQGDKEASVEASVESRKLQDCWRLCKRQREHSCECLVSHVAARIFQKKAKGEVIIGAY